MRKKSLLIILLVAGILFSVSGVVAGDVDDVTLTSDANDTTISIDNNDFAVESDIDDMEVSSNAEDHPLEESSTENKDDGTFTALQLKVSNADAGSTINLYNDYKYNSGFKLTTGVFINKDITINGNGHSIDGMGQSRIFNINYGNGLKFNKVTLKNINFKNGNAKIYGGAILNFGELTVDHCTFTSNKAGTAGGAINSLGALTLKNSKFYKNSAGGDAGAVFSLTLKKGAGFYYQYFEGRNATEDQNIMFTLMQAVLEPGKDTISNCVFTQNQAKGRGGGAVYAFSHIDINSCTFKSNKANESGGAVFANKNIVIKNSKFSYNTVKKRGGAVYFRCHSLTGHYKDGKWVSDINYYTCLIESSTFKRNVAKNGGAIYGFKYNDTDKKHGAKAVKCTFDENKAKKGRDVYGGTASKCKFLYYKVILKKTTIKKSAKKLVLKATLKKANKVVKGKKVIFKFRGKYYKAKTNKKGIAKVIIKKSVLDTLKVGKKVTIKATYKAFSGKVIAKKKFKVVE